MKGALPMANRLYVGNLSYSTTEADLRSLFEESGTVRSCDLVVDRHTDQSRGFAFVEMASTEDAQKAIEQWHDQEFQGRALVVNEARPREDRGPNRYMGTGAGVQGGRPQSRSGKGSRRGIRKAKRGGSGYW